MSNPNQPPAARADGPAPPDRTQSLREQMREVADAITASKPFIARLLREGAHALLEDRIGLTAALAEVATLKDENQKLNAALTAQVNAHTLLRASYRDVEAEVLALRAARPQHAPSSPANLKDAPIIACRFIDGVPWVEDKGIWEPMPELTQAANPPITLTLSALSDSQLEAIKEELERRFSGPSRRCP